VKSQFSTAMETLRPLQWHHSDGRANTPGVEELESWKDIPFILIVVSCNSKIPGRALRDWLAQTDGLREQDFYCVIDKDDTELVWGKRFHDFMQSMKKKKYNDAKESSGQVHKKRKKE
jgi:hypothetical protein